MKIKGLKTNYKVNSTKKVDKNKKGEDYQNKIAASSTYFAV